MLFSPTLLRQPTQLQVPLPSIAFAVRLLQLLFCRSAFSDGDTFCRSTILLVLPYVDVLWVPKVLYTSFIPTPVSLRILSHGPPPLIKQYFTVNKPSLSDPNQIPHPSFHLGTFLQTLN
ncbi:hypothetical protein CRM22_006118 [Opisthorchis felineus]|uniref:Uncharacterized protein n=1 Tax=Opisthorchis felineus TaxID=147828 RepID=A0A4S2LMR6_OPIFE|nr:hypothetical protein CRM22_006118 [Opisthorchis felineus]